MRHLLLSLTIVSLLAACSGTSGGGSNRAGEIQNCNGEQRVMLDCSSEVSYQGVSGEAGVSVMDIASAQGKFEERAIRRVNEQVEQFAAAQTRACREYNGCVLSAEQYRAEAAETRRRLQVLPALMEALKSAKSEDERIRALDALYRGVVPDDKRVEEVTFRLGMVAEMPEALGGGVYSIAPGGAVPTGAKVHFKVDVSRDAHVYIFQVTPKGEINVLFPDPRIGTKNPLPGGVSARIPGSKAFRVTEDDVGTEKVYIVASREPVSNLDSALAKVKAGEVSTLAQDQMLQTVAMVSPPDTSTGCKTRALALDDGPDPGGGDGGCVRSRALQLDADASEAPSMGGGVPPSMTVRTPPGDGLIVTVFPFEHLTEQQYASAGGATAPGHRTRGIVVEE